MQTNHADIAACISKEGHARLLEVRAALLAQAEGGAGDAVTEAGRRKQNRRQVAAALRGRA